MRVEVSRKKALASSNERSELQIDEGMDWQNDLSSGRIARLRAAGQVMQGRYIQCVFRCQSVIDPYRVYSCHQLSWWYGPRVLGALPRSVQQKVSEKAELSRSCKGRGLIHL